MKINHSMNINFKSGSRIISDLAKAADKINIQGGNEKEKAINLLSEKNKFQLLGTGGTSRVYKIPHTKYALQTPRNSTKNMTEFETTGLSAQEKFNNILAKDSKHNCKILRCIDGLHSQKAFDVESEEDYCTIVSNMPQDAYDDFLKKVVLIHKNALFFDTYGDNMIIDIENGRFEPIDLMDKNYCANYMHILKPSIKFNPIDCMYQATYNSMLISDYLLFFAKCAKSLAKDCKYFPYFSYKIDSSSKIEKDEYLRKTSKDLYEKLIKLHKKKLDLKEKGMSEAEIAEYLKTQIDEYIKMIDKQILYDEDLTKKELLEIQKRIESKTGKNKSVF